MLETANKYNNGMGLAPDSAKYKTVEKMLSPEALQEYQRLSGQTAAGSPASQGASDGTLRQQAPAGSPKPKSAAGSQAAQVPAGPPRPKGFSDDEIRQQAKAAIAAGKPAAAVRTQLQHWGVSPP